MKPMMRRKDGSRTAVPPMPLRATSMQKIQSETGKVGFDKPVFTNLAERFL